MENILHPYIRHYFQQHPQLKKCYQTFDGLIHPSQEAAESWVAKYVNKKIEVHINPIYDGEVEDVDAEEGEAKEADATEGEAKEADATGGDATTTDPKDDSTKKEKKAGSSKKDS